MPDPIVTAQMTEAGVQAMVPQLPAEVFEERSVDPAQLVTTIYQAMSRHQWLPIRTAPHDGSNVMLGTFIASGFKQGIGCFVPADDDVGTGQWSTESWWGKAPTHWMPLPAPPPAPLETA